MEKLDPSKYGKTGSIEDFSIYHYIFAHYVGGGAKFKLTYIVTIVF